MKENFYFRNWNNNFSCRPRYYFAPDNENEIPQIIQIAKNEGKTLRPVGSGFSFTPLMQTDDILVSLNKLSGIESIDLDIPAVTVKGGTSLQDLQWFLAAQDFALSNMGDIAGQTVAGAISTATHGTGRSLGNLSDDILEMTLFDGRGNLRVIKDRDSLKSAAVSLGCLGIIVSVKIKIMPHYWLRADRGKISLDQALRDLDSNVSENRNFEMYWFPNTDIVHTKKMNLTEVRNESFRQRLVRPVNDYLVENGAVWMINRADKMFPKYRPHITRLVDRLVPREISFEPAQKAYTTPRWVRHNEIEYAIEAKYIQAALADLIRATEEAKTRVWIPIEVRFSRSDDLYLSPSFKRDVAYIAAHTFAQEDYRDYFHLVESVMKKYDGRPHWGKLHFREAHDFPGLYPEWETFHRVRREYDPDGIFLNSYLKKIFST